MTFQVIILLIERMNKIFFPCLVTFFTNKIINVEIIITIYITITIAIIIIIKIPINTYNAMITIVFNKDDKYEAPF